MNHQIIVFNFQNERQTKEILAKENVKSILVNSIKIAPNAFIIHSQIDQAPLINMIVDEDLCEVFAFSISLDDFHGSSSDSIADRLYEMAKEKISS